MAALNQQASILIRGTGAHACTDVTGFGLLGHASEVAEKSGVGIVIDSGSLPWLPGSRRYATEERFPGGTFRNRDFYETLPSVGVTFSTNIDESICRLMYSPETSGGLLVSVPEESGADLLEAFEAVGHEIWEIGAVTGGGGINVR